MSLFTDAIAALSSGRTLIMGNDIVTGAYTDVVGGNTLTVAGSPTIGGQTGPCDADTPNTATSLALASSQWWDAGQGSKIQTAIGSMGSATGLTLCGWVRMPSASSAQSWWMSSRTAGGINGFLVGLNTNIFENYAANTISIFAYDNATGYYKITYGPPNNEACNWDGWVFLNIFISTAGVILRINGATLAEASHSNAAFGTTTGASAGKWVLGGYSQGAGAIGAGFTGTYGPSAALTGQLTVAEEQSILAAGPTKYGAAPVVRFRFSNSGTDMLKAGGSVAVQGEVVERWKNTGSTSGVVADIGKTAGADYGGPKRTTVYNGLAFNNLWQATNSPDTGAPYQMGFLQDSGIPKILSNVGSFWFACRPVGTRTLSSTAQTLVSFLSGTTTVASLVLTDDRVTFVRGAAGAEVVYDATSVPYTRTAPSLCAVGITYAYGTVTVYVLGSSGTTSASPANSTAVIDKIVVGGNPRHYAGAGTYDGMLTGIAYTGGHSECVLSAANMQTLLASLYTAHGSGDAQSPITDVVVGGDSIGGGQNSTDCLTWNELLANYFHGPSWVNRSHPSDKMADTYALGWTSGRLWSATSTKQYVLIQTIRNDISASTARATVKANLTSIITDARATKPGCKLIVLGCTPGDSTLASSQATARANYETDARDVIANNGGGGFISLESMTDASYYVADHIHLTNAGHAEMARLVAKGLHAIDSATFPLPSGGIRSRSRTRSRG